MLHAPTGKLALEKLMLPDPATAVTVPPQVLVTPGVAATTSPAGRVSVKLASTAITLGLVTAKVSVDETPIATGFGLKLLTMRSGSRITMLAVTVAWSTVASACPLPLVPPALKVAVAVGTGLPRVSGWACGIVPRMGLLNVIGSPTITSRFPARAVPTPWLSLLMSPVSVVLWLIRMMDGLAVCVSAIKGSKVVVPLLVLTIVVAGVFTPHQLFVTVAVEWLLFRLLALAAVLPARRLKLMEKACARVGSPESMPPPAPVAVFPVMVALEIVITSGLTAWQWIPPPFPPALLPLITVRLVGVPALSIT